MAKNKYISASKAAETISDNRAELLQLIDALYTVKTDIEKADKYYCYACSCIADSAKDMTYQEVYDEGLNDVNEALNKYTAKLNGIDAAEVKHAEWIGTDGDNADYESGHSAWIEFHCSSCNYEMSLETGEYGWGYDEDNKIPFNYCPNCGAKMDGGDSE